MCIFKCMKCGHINTASNEKCTGHQKFQGSEGGKSALLISIRPQPRLGTFDTSNIQGIRSV